MFFANPSTEKVRDAMRAGHLGMIDTPAQGNRHPGDVAWCADNSCFGDAYPGDIEFVRWLARKRHMASRCAFVVAPDVPRQPDGTLKGDAKATLKRSEPFLEVIRALGFPAAFVAQNGLEELAVPWDWFDVLFLGGDDAFKLGGHVRDLTLQARARGKHVHMGRVNSLRRLKYADAIGCHSADGTYLAFGPDTNLPKLLGWMRAVNDQQPLWEAS
jgi:hypothetical protein